MEKSEEVNDGSPNKTDQCSFTENDSARETIPNETSNDDLNVKETDKTENEFVIDTQPLPGFQNPSVVKSSSELKINDALIRVNRPLCADYESDSDSDSHPIDSESDSSTTNSSDSESESDGDSDSEDESDISKTSKQEKKSKSSKSKTDLSLCDLPPIEDLKISVPEDSCVEVGTISSIVDTLVVVESYKGSAALNVDTVLFLDHGKRALGKIFDILGPILEPVYTVRFNSSDQITEMKIEKGLKVYFAPKTQHTSFVFLSEVLKNRGSDASWKDNIEAPQEFQDFSDDEEERKSKAKAPADSEDTQTNRSNASRKRSFHKTGSNFGKVSQGRKFNSETAQPRFSLQSPRFNPPMRFNPVPPVSHYRVPPPSRPMAAPMFPFNVPPYPGNNFMTALPPPRGYFPPRFSGPPFPTFGGHLFSNQNGNNQMMFFQPRAHEPSPAWGSPFSRPPPPPPPPPPPSSQPSS